MRLISLQSGSNGNCILVQSKDVRLFFDAGLSGVKVEARLAQFGLTAHDADGLFISHDHSDHISCAGVFVRKFACPLYITRRTLQASQRRMGPGHLPDVRFFKTGDVVRIKHLSIETIPTPHDGVDGAIFVVDDGLLRLAICTDLGHVYADLRSVVRSVDGLFIESNYDVDMLANGPYPVALKRRISGPRGHISNLDAAELVSDEATSRLKWLALGHLSQENNTPQHVMNTHRCVLGKELDIEICPRYGVSRSFDLGSYDSYFRTPKSFAMNSDLQRPLERFWL